MQQALIARLGKDSVHTDRDISHAHAGDWSKAPKVVPGMVISPRAPEQVADALAILNEYKQKVVIQGGLTGLAGAATPCTGEVALSLTNLNHIGELDHVGGTITVEAGVTLEQLQIHVDEHGWLFALDLGARGSCQIGGNAATNAGGNRVVRYGTMRDLVLGIEVALADGTLVNMMNQVQKNTTGIDLKHLFIGSEGTLGVITRLILKLSPKPSSTITALCALNSFEAATVLLKRMQQHLPTLSAFELMWQDFMDASTEVGSMKTPFPAQYPVYVLIELMGTSEEKDRQALEEALEAVLEDGTVQDVIVAQSLEQSKRLWRYRESIAELMPKLEPHAAFDVSIPMKSMEQFVEKVRETLKLRFPAQSHLFFGHLGDDNLHLLSGPYADAQELCLVEKLVYAAVQNAQGAISAEHGIGVVKKEFLHFSRSSEEITMMQGIKRLLDPQNILNAGRVCDSASA